MDIIIGSARADEKGTYTGGAPGDQKQKSIPDYSGEVSMQPFYTHKKGWVIIRLKDPAHARRMAIAVERACNNPNLGYNQLNRLGIVRESTSAKKPTDCDCSSLMRVAFREATGKDPGNFTTANEVAALEKTGLVEDPIPYTKGTPLYLGDILVTKTKGHTASVVKAPERPKTSKTTDEDITTRLAWDVIKGKAGSGWDARRAYITACGGNVAMVRAKVNELKKQGAF